MNTEEALAFLREHQPLVVVDGDQARALDLFDLALEHFAANPDPRCVPLILGFFGEGDGYGVYQLADNTLASHDNEVVVPVICENLGSATRSIRYWNALMALNYSDPRLVRPLLELYKIGDVDERAAAMAALATSGPVDTSIRKELLELSETESDPEVRTLISEALG